MTRVRRSKVSGRPAPARSTSTPWVTQLRADHRVLSRHAADRPLSRALIAAAPRLADSRHAEELDEMLARAGDSSDVELALARGRRSLVHNRSDDALRWLAQAQSLANGKETTAVARIAFLLGSIYVGRSELVAADSVLAWAEGMLGRRSATSADVLHLRALIAEARGERDAAMALYRDVLKRANVALTPMSRVLAMRNLAEALAHSEPHESSALYGLALAVLDADELDTPMRCTIDNGMGYALLCGGDIEGARLKLGQALTEAERVRSARVQLYARFNLSIVDELSGDLGQAEAGLRAVEADAQRYNVEGLTPWVRIRLAWLKLRSGTAASARTALRQAFPAPPGIGYRDAVAALSAILDLEERRPSARADLSALAATYRDRGDALTDFTLTLWVAHADAVGGRVAAARRNATLACTTGSQRGFRVGTNWWAPQLVTVAREHAPAEFGDFVDRLIAPPSAPASSHGPRVVVSRDGTVAIAGRTLDEASWRSGRSGSGVLRRYFRALLSAYPAALGRDELADLLWPESEGDKAVRNLYGATNDLRSVLAAVPGVRLQVAEGRYCLILATEVDLR
jgi:tetratricopeptide (TPR) repeat protein